MKRLHEVVLSLLVVAFNAVGADSDNTLISIVLDDERINIDSCTPLKIVRDNTKQGINNTVLFVFKYSEGVKLFSDKQCKNVKEGIGQLTKDSSPIYYFKINRSGKFSISLIGIGKEKWRYTKNFVSTELEKVQESVKERQIESLEAYQKEGKLPDNEVVDLINLEGEIREIAYRNLKLEIHHDQKYRTNQCVGPINMLIPNMHNIIHGKQYAEYDLKVKGKTLMYIDDKCTKEIQKIKFDAETPLVSIYLKNDNPSRSEITISKKQKRVAYGEFSFEDPPEEYDEKKEIIKFEKRLNRTYFVNNVLNNLTDPIQKETYQKMFDNYEYAKKNNLDYQKDVLEGLFMLDSGMNKTK